MIGDIWLQKFDQSELMFTNVFRILDKSGHSFILFNNIQDKSVLDYFTEFNYIEEPYQYLEPTIVRVKRKRKDIEIEIE